MIGELSINQQVQRMFPAPRASRHLGAVGAAVAVGCETERVDRTTLVAALQHGTDAAQECSSAVLAGSEFEIFDGTVLAVELVRTYRRRAEHLMNLGLDHGGFEDAVAALDALSESEVRLGQVSDDRAKRHYQLFLDHRSDEVVGCLWVRHDG